MRNFFIDVYYNDVYNVLIYYNSFTIYNNYILLDIFVFYRTRLKVL
jgi:hypothetical protein